MKNILSMVAISCAALMFSCAPKADKTIENLKAAANGESTASADYALFSQKAAEEGYPMVANMFAATSHAESIHAARHIEELAKLGVKDYVPTVTPAVVGTTLENLTEANDGEVYEFTTMYPGFIETAIAEKAMGAQASFEAANAAEKKHSVFYTAAIEALSNPEAGDSTFNAVWVICPKCGDTYMQSQLGATCDLCGTAAEQFIIFKNN